ncbi:MAG: bifunctional folylpolyglutamate synthase/dihydrofolate synthase [Leucobacter sp.]
MSAVEQVFEQLLERVGEARPRPRIEPVRRLAELAGSPQESYPVILVAGTNGKTSTSRAIASLLHAHGLRTGLFTSPHLVDFTERFQNDGEPVDENILTESWDELQLALQVVDAELEAAGNGPITFFEALSVLAYSVFADAPVEVAVIEVGMGGEWDATNIVDPQVAVFTPIALDHTEILGYELAQVAHTKAGIIKPGSTVVSAAQEEDALAELTDAAATANAKLLIAGTDFHLTDDRLAVGGRQISLQGTSGNTYDPAFIPLFGQYQAENVAVAVAAVEAFFGGDRPVPEEILVEAFGQLTVPGRLQLIGADPIVYVDAAHNPHGMRALVQAVTESFNFEELAVVVGVLGDKDVTAMLAELAPIATLAYLTPVDSPRSLGLDELEDAAESVLTDTAVERAVSLPEALDVARGWADRAENRAVLVVGSVLLAGEAIAHSRDEGWGIA